MRWILFISCFWFSGELLQHVRFPLISPAALVDHVESVDYLEGVPECEALVKEALHYHCLPARQSLLQVRSRFLCIVSDRGVAICMQTNVNIERKHNKIKFLVLRLEYSEINLRSIPWLLMSGTLRHQVISGNGIWLCRLCVQINLL